MIIVGEPDYYPKHGFIRAGSLGLTDGEGNVYDPFIGSVQQSDKLEFDALAVRLPLPMGEVPAGRRGPSQSASLTALP